MEQKQGIWEGLAIGYFIMAAMGAMMFVVIAVMDLAGVKLVGDSVALGGQTNGWISLVALVVAGLGALCLLVELGKPFKCYLVMCNPKSIMTIGAYFLAAFFACSFIYATFFFSFIPWSGIVVLQKSFAVLGIVAALVLVAYPGIELGEARGRRFWNGSALVPLFLISATISGVAGVILMMVLFGYSQDSATAIIGYVLSGLIVLQLISLAGYMMSMSKSGVQEVDRAVEMILHGRYKEAFWAGAFFVGLVVPLLMSMLGSASVLLAFKAILVIIGCVCFRYVFIGAAVTQSLPGSEHEACSDEEAVHLAVALEKRWKEKEVWLNSL